MALGEVAWADLRVPTIVVIDIGLGGIEGERVVEVGDGAGRVAFGGPGQTAFRGRGIVRMELDFVGVVGDGTVGIGVSGPPGLDSAEKHDKLPRPPPAERRR